jgi:KUP system potassium uptake protein
MCDHSRVTSKGAEPNVGQPGTEPGAMTAALAPDPSGPGHSTKAVLTLGALGVVFGDIGTSPLYSLQTAFSIEHNSVQPIPGDVFGIISMVFWSITILVSLKYVALVMRADNDGEGGILALVALLRQKLGDKRTLAAATLLGMFGVALFYGDSVITPAISVLSAMEGLVVINPSLGALVLPVSVVILAALFAIQRFGTHLVGRAFGPVMAVWFVVLAILGLPHIIQYPKILVALSPTYAIAFLVEHPLTAFIALGAVVLTVTGAEALYADMGHFGAGPIRTAWFVVVFPCLTINYLGQGALILHDPSTIDHPFFHLAPAWATLPLVVLATLATVIASQSVISGTYSASQQGMLLGVIPRLRIRHTSREAGGQIYLPAVNWILFCGVLLLIAVFQSSTRLATAFGLAVTGTLILTSLLYLLLARAVWRWPLWRILGFGVVILGVEIAFLAANLIKVLSGGWLPLLIAAVLVTLMITWRDGLVVLQHRRIEIEGPLTDFVDYVHRTGITRVPGLAVVPHPNSTTAPLALRTNVDFNKVLHEHVIIVQIVIENVPHIRHVDRVTIQELGDTDDGIVHVCVRVGFADSQDIPKGLALAIGKTPELDVDPEEAHYFLSLLDVHATGNEGMRAWRKRLFVWMAHATANRTEDLHLPPDRTIVIGARLDL